MSISALILLLLCVTIPLIIVVVFGFFVYKAKIRYGNYVDELRARGVYKTWKAKHRHLYLTSNISLLLFLLSFMGFMGVAALLKTNTGADIARLLFSIFVTCGILYIVSTAILYFSVPKNK